MTFDIGLHEVCVRVGGRTLRRIDGLPNFVIQGAPLRALRARESSAMKTSLVLYLVPKQRLFSFKKQKLITLLELSAQS